MEEGEKRWGRGGKKGREGWKTGRMGMKEKCADDNFDGLLKLSDGEQQANYWESQAQEDPAFLWCLITTYYWNQYAHVQQKIIRHDRKGSFWTDETIDWRLNVIYNILSLQGQIYI